MSIAYPVTLNVVFNHTLVFPINGVCEIENNTPYYLYVALGLWASATDITSQNVATIPPFQKRAFKSNIHNQTPALSLVARDVPFKFSGNIAGSAAVVRINEYSDPKEYFPNQSSFEGLAADYLVIAGGRITANQFGLFETDAGNQPAFGLVGDGLTWDGQAVNQGDFIVGPYFSQGKGLYWDALNQLLHVKGEVIVSGGNAISLAGITGTWTVTDYRTLQWSGVKVYLSDNTFRDITNSSYVAASLIYLCVSISPVVSPTVIVPGTSPAAYPFIVIGLFIPNPDTSQKGTLLLSNGATIISSNKISVSQLSALSADLGSITAGLITSATIRTDAGSVPQAQLDPNGLALLADNNAWLKWLNSAGSQVGHVTAYDQIPGSTDKLVMLRANPDQLAIGGQATIYARPPLPHTGYATLSAGSRGQASYDAAALGVVNDSSQTVFVNVKIGRVWIGSNALLAFPGLIVGGSDRTPAKTLDVTGDGAFSGDVYAAGQVAGGLYDRAVAKGYTPTFHFESSSAALSWAGAPFATPASVFYSHPSVLSLVDGAAIRAFLFKAVNLATNAAYVAMARLALTSPVTDRIGLRVDDGTDNNYAEVYFKSTGAAGGFGTCDLYMSSRVGGGAETTTALTNRHRLGYYLDLSLSLAADTNCYAYLRDTSYQQIYVGTILAGRAFTTTRVGLVAKGNPNIEAEIDWLLAP